MFDWLLLTAAVNKYGAAVPVCGVTQLYVFAGVP
jgi:hypothetical protein